MSVIFGDAQSLHKHLLKFAARSGKQVQHGSETYTIHHTQFGLYDVQEAFTTVLEQTESDPRVDREFQTEAESALEDSYVSLDSDLQHHYLRREYIEPRDFWSAASDYRQALLSEENDELPNLNVVQPSAKSREEAVAEVFSLMHADAAGMDAFLPFNSPYSCDDEDDKKPDECVSVDEAAFALRDTAHSLHGPSVLTRPDPSLHTTRVLYELYDEYGMKHNVRHIYGVLVSHLRPRFYEPDDADTRRFQRSIGRSMMGEGDATEKWTSNKEPPLDSLDSYDQIN